MLHLRCFTMMTHAELPILSNMDHGYPVHLLIQALLSDSNPICQVQPMGVTRNSVFQIDLDKVGFEDLKADDLGSWTGTGTKRTHLSLTQSSMLRVYHHQHQATFC